MKTELIAKAKKLYKDGTKLVDIAAQLNIPPGTVRRWKSEQKWDGSRANTERSELSSTVDKKAIKAVESNKELTEEQKTFCLYYSKTFNATMAYKKAYQCSYNNAKSHGYELLRRVEIRNEIARLKEIRASALLATADDVVEKYMLIAFADITDYLDFGRATVQVMGPYGPMYEGKGKDKKPVKKEVNEIRLKESSEVDGTLLTEVKQGKDGTSVKLADRMKALDFLKDYFELNPMDKHRIEYENKKLELEKQKLAGDKPPATAEDDPITASLKEELQK